MDTPDDPVSLWRRAVQTLLAKGMSPAEAIDGANLIAAAFRRQQDEEEAREQGPDSGTRRAG